MRCLIGVETNVEIALSRFGEEFPNPTGLAIPRAFRIADFKTWLSIAIFGFY